ncbi:MAG: isocitrate lyase/PEP mutase family protein [Pyramidobacter sp.]|uniref:isocitrate lyase/PEP mutase family protein n=1 Tax=Pyramidobacter sp. TaxID=1943581 RepID=UPI002A7F98A7|nr:isocitrate lyase/PEP mutase family protein [Pyramidobacter sp.]MDY4031727.1 isocitrate lyase/PEP mutase family protein [Pyramidobacter sp.]
MTKTKAKKLRELLSTSDIITAPGAYDAWSARLIERAGFPAVYMTGYGVSASVLGKPDIGLVSFHEMVEMARNIAEATNVPVIADADNGYGGALNVVRTVRAYEQANVAGIQLEDQVMPKRCGHMEGKQLIPCEEMVAKVRAAVYARRDPDTVIIARTDARAISGLEDALARGHSFEDAGADVIFIEAPQSVDEMKHVVDEFPNRPLLVNVVEHGKTPNLSQQDLAGLGFKIAIYPVMPVYVVTKALNEALAKLKVTGSNEACLNDMVDFPSFNELIGLGEMRKLEKSFTCGK